jgi:hypothetical protein
MTSPLHTYLAAAKALIAPPYTEVIEVEAEVQLIPDPRIRHVWRPSHAVTVRNSPTDWYHSITYIPTAPDVPFDAAPNLFHAVGKLVLATYRVEGGKLAIGPRRVQSFEKNVDGLTYTLILRWPSDVITSTEPPEVLKYGFRMKGEDKVGYVYQTDLSQRAAVLTPLDLVVQSPAQRDAREHLLYEWLRTITEALLHIPRTPSIPSVTRNEPSTSESHFESSSR